MRKFFVDSESLIENEIRIFGSDVNHIKNVLRLKNGDKIQICNKDSKENYICEITEIQKDSVKTNILEKIEEISEGNIELDIFQGLPKADKMELIIQKGTELGVSKFIPVNLKRCIVKLDGKDEIKKIERWQKIAEVAAKQCQRDIVPNVEKIFSIKDVCDRISCYDLFLLAYEEEKLNYIKSELLNIKNTKENLKIGVMIGPEGGIDSEEEKILKENGAKIVSLGKRILRTETVALAVSSIIMYELEE